MAQKLRLLEYLKDNDTIEPMKAWTELGIYRLAARINDLRNDGYIITTETKVVTNRFGENCQIANYRITL